MDDTPTLQPRPKLHGWLSARGMGGSDLARRWGITPQGASRYLLPFGNERRITPTEAQIADVLSWTSGEVAVSDWYPQHLSRTPLPVSTGVLPVDEAV